MKTDCCAIVLAAGIGTRMKSKTPKVLHTAAGKPIAAWVTDAAREAAGQTPVVVVGNGAEQVKQYFGDSVSYALQDEQQGTGHAVMCAKEYLKGDGYALVVAGDMPLLRAETLRTIIDAARAEGLGLCLLTAIVEDARGYGRIVRGGNGTLRIVEQKDATPEELNIKEVNPSVYCFKIPYLLEALSALKNNNSQKEYYITDCVKYISDKGYGVKAVVCADADECRGVNDRAQLADAARLLKKRINTALMLDGVTLLDPDNTYIEAGVSIAQDVTIYPGVTLEGSTVIAEDAILYPGSRISNSNIGKGTKVQNSVILDSAVGDNSTIGPYAYLRPGSVIGNGCRVGDFVEVKNSVIKDGAKVSHLTYIGDGEIGEKTNIGCGVVFVNYDGQKKSRTKVGKNAFIGCNVNLIAPVTVEDGAYVAAGSTVTKDVESDALCVARCRQTVIEGWAKRRRGE